MLGFFLPYENVKPFKGALRFYSERSSPFLLPPFLVNVRLPCAIISFSYGAASKPETHLSARRERGSGRLPTTRDAGRDV